jgi:hypothetical protein
VTKLSKADEEKIRKDFTFDGKYAFDKNLTEEEKRALLMLRVEKLIKDKKLDAQQAKKVKSEWTKNIDKIGVDKFEDEIKKTWTKMDSRLTGGRLTTVGQKIKSEIWKGYKSPVANVFNNMADIIMGNY